MAANGYSFVTDHGFGAFAQDLDQGAWASVDIQPFDTEEGIAKAPLADAPLVVAWKLRVLWGIRALAAAAGTDVLAELDAEWDSAQRAFHLGVATAEEHKSPVVRAAAGRVRGALLSPSGTAQNALDYEKEVDFGRDQVKRGSAGALAEDVETIGATHHVARIHDATEAFAKALGRDENKGRAPARGRRLRAALVTCSTAFNGVHDEITWAIEHTADQAERARLGALLAPFQALLARYPSPTAAKAADQGADPTAPTPPPT
jgi:hypothetical protein